MYKPKGISDTPPSLHGSSAVAQTSMPSSTVRNQSHGHHASSTGAKGLSNHVQTTTGATNKMSQQKSSAYNSARPTAQPADRKASSKAKGLSFY